MKLYIPERIHSKIVASVNEGTGGRILGTISTSDKVASISSFETQDCEALSSSRYLLSDLSSNSGPLSFELENGSLSVKFTSTGEYHSSDDIEIVLYKDEDFFKRTPYDKTIMNHLKSKKVLIVGLGSVGSVMGMELATSGVGALVGMDKDILEIHNCMRHLLGPAYVGWPKPTAMKHHFDEHVPTCEFTPVYGDLFTKENRHELKKLMEREKPTHILAVTDVLKVQYWCQRLAVEYNLPLMAVGCDNNAVEGEIFMWEPGQATAWKEGQAKRGCYACLRPMNAPSLPRSDHFDYNTDDPNSFGGEPALGTFINRVNNIASIFMLAWLLRDCETKTKLASILDKEYGTFGVQYIRLGGAHPMENSTTITAEKPWGVEWNRVRHRENCDICGNKENNHNVLFPIIDNTPDVWE